MTAGSLLLPLPHLMSEVLKCLLCLPAWYSRYSARETREYSSHKHKDKETNGWGKEKSHPALGETKGNISFSSICSPLFLCTSTELPAMKSCPYIPKPRSFSDREKPLPPFSQKAVQWVEFFFFLILLFWFTYLFITNQDFSVGGSVCIWCRDHGVGGASGSWQAAALLQHLQFDASTLHGCQHAMTDCPPPPCRLHLDAVRADVFSGALVRHQAGALGLCLWEWMCGNLAANVMTETKFYTLMTFQSPTGKSTIGCLWYISYKKPVVHTLDGWMLGIET